MTDTHLSKAQLYEQALKFHQGGKTCTNTTKPLDSQFDLSLAYSPGVAAPCREIYKDPRTSYDFTAKGNLIAVITNGTAVLGLGNLGALAAKPVMEGKCALFKKFGLVNAIDLEIDTENPEEFIQVVRLLSKSVGGINLEDIKAPECFTIEKKLIELLDIPVFHDDQHGTAIVTAAGILNALEIVGKKLQDIKLVINGAGSAAIACIELLKVLGLGQAIMCDTKGVIYRGRGDLNPWKEVHAVDTTTRTLKEAIVGADIFLGLSVHGALTQDMVATMANKPIILAMANPDPEIEPKLALETRPDCIIATGRSDHNNQINNLLCFPYIFRGALDTLATKINSEMKKAAVYAIAEIAKLKVPQELSAIYKGKTFDYGPEYIVPLPFDRRLITEVSAAVAVAAMQSGVARRNIDDIEQYKRDLLEKASSS